MPNVRLMSTSADFRFIDLFAGLGGFHVALKRLKGECVLAAEWQEHLRVLYKENHAIDPVGDINDLAAREVPDHDVLTAGFPCQPFSKAGEQLGFACTKQGQLFFNVKAILAEKRPTFFILENVANLLKHNDGATMKDISAALTGLGYDIRTAKLSPHQFGIPQIRERVYIVGSRHPLTHFAWPETSKEPTSLADVLDVKPDGAKALSSQVTQCLDAWNDFLKRCPANVELPYYPLWTMEWGANYPFEGEPPLAAYTRLGKRALAKMRGSHGVKLGQFAEAFDRLAALPSHARNELFAFPTWKQHFIRSNRNFYAENQAWIDPWIKQVLRFPSSLQKLEWNVKGGERDIYKYVIQFRASGVRVKRPTKAPSLVAMTDTQVPIIGWERRYMTERECARIQSLGSLKSLPASRPKAFAALGNAVNADVVERVARALFAGVGPAPTASAPRLIAKVLGTEAAEAC